jgi:NAD(P)-dependent dehydrogenase (short-subunit alcohol dehydrogenase family)
VPQKIILVTGATDGLGRRVAEKLASPDIHLLLHGRNGGRGQEVVKAVEAAGGSATFYQADFASLEAVRRLAKRIAAEHSQIDVLINNAGIALADGPRRTSEDGYELTFAVNYLAPFLLTRLLLPCLGRARPSRIINVASAGQAPLDFGNVMLERGYEGMLSYRQSKLAQIMFTFDMAEELKGTNVTTATLHPSTYMDTTMVRTGGITPISSVDTGADAVIALVQKPVEAVSGRYFDVQRESRANGQAYDREARRKLRDLSMKLTGLDAR